MISSSVGLIIIGFTVSILLLLNLRPTPQEDRVEVHIRKAARRIRKS